MSPWCRLLVAPFQTAVLVLLGALGWLICIAPNWHAPIAIDVRLPSGAATTLGRDSLAANHADGVHLGLRHAADGAWWVSNLSVSKGLLVEHDGGEESPRHLPVETGMHLDISGHTFAVLAVHGRQLALLDDNGQRWDYDGFFLTRDGEALASCPGLPLRQRAFETWNRLVPTWLDANRPLRLGGLVHCGNRLGVDGIPPSAALFVPGPTGYVVSGSHVAIGYRKAGESGSTLELARRELRVDSGVRLTIGHTRFDVAVSGDTLTLTPIYRMRWYAQPLSPARSDIAWTWATADPWRLPVTGLAWTGLPLLAAAVLLACALAGYAPFDRRTPAGYALTGSGGLVLAALALTELGFGSRLGIGWSVAVYVLAALGWLGIPRRGVRGTWLIALWLMLLTSGLGSLLELGLGAQESHWLRHAQRSMAIATLGLGVGLSLRVAIRHRILASPAPVTIDKVLVGIAGLACQALLLQWVAGSETGVAGFQPVEFAKLALVVLGAHALASRSEWTGADRPPWLRFLAPVSISSAIVVIALTLVHDYSPIVLLAFWILGMVIAWGAVQRSTPVLIGVSLLVVVVIACWAWVLQTGQPDIVSGGFYTDRFSVWLAPGLHPHTGQQFHQGALAILQGGWSGSSALGVVNGDVMAVPAVESDFAPAFFLNRHGLYGGMVLACIQSWLILTLALTVAGALRTGTGGDYRRAWALRWGAFSICGGGAFLLGHFVVSWSTNLGVLPVMGQPMPLLSAGGSHLLFFVLPLLVGSVILAEETSDEAP